MIYPETWIRAFLPDIAVFTIFQVSGIERFQVSVFSVQVSASVFSEVLPET